MNKNELRRDGDKLVIDVHPQIKVWVEQARCSHQWAVHASLHTPDPETMAHMATSEAWGLIKALDLAWLVALTIRNTFSQTEFEEACREVHNMLPSNALIRNRMQAFLPATLSTAINETKKGNLA